MTTKMLLQFPGQQIFATRTLLTMAIFEHGTQAGGILLGCRYARGVVAKKGYEIGSRAECLLPEMEPVPTLMHAIWNHT